MVRAAPAQEIQPQPKKKGATELDQQFEQIMKQLLVKARATEAELQAYERLARAREEKGISWRDFLKQVLEAPAPAPEARTIDSYLRAAVAAQTPKPLAVKKAPESAEALKAMVATKKIPDEPALTQGAVRSTVELAFALESQDVKRLNFRKWCGEEAGGQQVV